MSPTPPMSPKPSTVVAPRLRRITMDLGDCSACEACTSLAPDVFGWDENTERPRLLKELVPQDQAQEVISFCPQDCISFDDEECQDV
ncbi:ferredoxin [Megalodesulfovibrio gigas]|uniref:Ferredoxin n=1 Tax=Megalodesulfovibrio gigas (strain ATCC 19364 / DSM 1382 / NCIMB 9332 / VKM B-1759) TaxID=1121448 RepID=T2GCP3_MEGG1|nr:ferredoxin [Megalodesulfovibrio gigas]AGW13901.1 hypothetical protein DGI_2139 [Megalodesulfovibrio gigas DSM 1382 = ATCC 19364]